MKLKTEWNKVTFYELMTNIFIAFFSFIALIRGVSYVVQTNALIYQNDTYLAISTIMSLKLYGIFFIVASVAALSTVFISGRTAFFLMTASNCCMFFLYLLYSLASAHNTLLEVTTYLNVLYTVVHLLVGVVGVLVICRKVNM